MNREKYMDTRFILPTSNVFERLFSVAGYALGDRRGRMLLSNFEEQIFLHINKELWGIEDVRDMLKLDREAQTQE